MSGMLLRTLVAGLAASLVVAGAPASAASQHQVSTFHGVVAEAVWDTSSPTGSTSTDLAVARNSQGRWLSLYQFTTSIDESGRYTGATLLTASAQTGFSLLLNGALMQAHVSATSLPATACTYNAADVLQTCNATTIDLAATWQGQGPISTTASEAHFHSDHFTSTYHERGFLRAATATGTVNGVPLSAADIVDAHLGKETYGDHEICVGSDC
jgi:hypothetical protein